MDAIAAARALLPPWVVWGNALLYPLLAFFLSLFGAWLSVRIASAPQRLLTPDSPWIERARRTYPARVMAFRNPNIALIVFFVLGFTFSGPINRVPAGILALLGGAAAYTAATCIRWRLARRLGLGANGLRAWLRDLLTDTLMLHLHVPIALFLLVLLPDRLNAMAWIVLAVGLLLLFGSAWGGGLFLARLAGLAQPADERLRKIVERAATETGIQPRAAYVISSAMPNACAFPLCKRLVFTEGILKVLDDRELSAVCAHELGHLSEPFLVTLGRLSPLLLFAAIAAGRLILAARVLPALIMLNAAVLLAVLMAILLSKLSRRMERRADRIAASDEGRSEVYARALEKLSQANLFPAVLAGRLATHPHLYDRLLAAGVTPAYERPKPPPQKSMMTATIVLLVLTSFLTGGSFALPILLRSNAGLRENESAILCVLALGGGSANVSDLARLHYKRDDKEGAVVFYRAAMEIDPQSLYAPVNLAITLAALDRCDEAKMAYVEAMDRGRKHGDSVGNRRLLKMALDAILLCHERRMAAEGFADRWDEQF